MVRNRHLLVLSHNYWPEPTGIPYYNTGMAEWFAARGGWAVTVLTGRPHYPWWEVPASHTRPGYWRGAADEERQGVQVLRAPHYVPRGNPNGLQRMLLDATWLLGAAWRSLFLRRRPSVMVLVAPPFLIGVLGLVLRWRFRRPVVYHVQDLQVDAARDLGMLPARLCRVLTGIERRLLARQDLVTTCSQGMCRRLQAKTRTRRPVVVFPNWADPDRLGSGSGAEGYRQEWAPLAGPVCLYSGNLGRKQGLDDLLAAFRLLAGLPLELVIAGRGAARGELEAALTPSAGLPPTRLLDLQPEQRLGDFLAAGDIHLIPQKRAVADLVMPSKLLNILAMARPVVVAAEPGTELARTVQESGCGVVVPPEDPAAFAAGVAELLADPQRREAMGAAGRRWLLAQRSAAGVLLGFCNRLDELLKGRSGHGQHGGAARRQAQHMRRAVTIANGVPDNGCIIHYPTSGLRAESL